MSNQTRDTETSLFLRFHVNQNKYESFMKMFARIGGPEPLSRLAGISKDSGDMHMVFKFIVQEGEHLRESVKTLHSIFLHLYDFYPAISEKPSDVHEESAKHFIRETRSKVLAYQAPTNLQASRLLNV